MFHLCVIYLKVIITPLTFLLSRKSLNMRCEPKNGIFAPWADSAFSKKHSISLLVLVLVSSVGQYELFGDQRPRGNAPPDINQRQKKLETKMWEDASNCFPSDIFVMELCCVVSQSYQQHCIDCLSSVLSLCYISLNSVCVFLEALEVILLC